MQFRLKALFFMLFLACAVSVLAADKPLDCGLETPLEKLAKRTVFLKNTDRLLLRTPRVSDLPAILPIFQDYQTVRYTWFWLGDGYWTEDTLRQRFESQAIEALKGNRHDFVIVLSDGSRKIIGRCAFFPGKGPGNWEFGITIHRPYWGNGYAADVLQTAIEYAFDEFGLNANALLFRTEPANVQMLKQYEKLGIPKILDAKDDVPDAEHPVHYHHFQITNPRS